MMNRTDNNFAKKFSKKDMARNVEDLNSSVADTNSVGKLDNFKKNRHSVPVNDRTVLEQLRLIECARQAFAK